MILMEQHDEMTLDTLWCQWIDKVHSLLKVNILLIEGEFKEIHVVFLIPDCVLNMSLAEKIEEDCDDELFCGVPLYTSRMAPAR